MEKEGKGIILSNPMERYVELDHNYFYKIHKMNVISKSGRKIYYDDENEKLIKPEIDYNMVISSSEDNDCNLYFVIDRKNNELEVMLVKRTDEKMPRKIYKEIRKINDEVSDYVKFNEVKKINIAQSFNIEYFTTLDDYSYIISINKNLINRKRNPKKNSKYEFGDVLSIYGVKDKCIFVCQNSRLIYTCSFDSFELFTGMNIYNEENVIDVYDKLDDTEKEKLLSKLKYASQNEEHIPRKAQVLVKKLVENRK